MRREKYCEYLFVIFLVYWLIGWYEERDKSGDSYVFLFNNCTVIIVTDLILILKNIFIHFFEELIDIILFFFMCAR